MLLQQVQNLLRAAFNLLGGILVAHVLCDVLLELLSGEADADLGGGQIVPESANKSCVFPPPLLAGEPCLTFLRLPAGAPIGGLIEIHGRGGRGFDWTDGWRGSAQFIVVQQEGDEADNGLECDNQEAGFDYFPRSKPYVYNMTVIGDPVTGTGSTRGMRLRNGTAGIVRNNIVMGFKGVGIDIDSTQSFQQVTDGDLVVDNNLLFGNLGGCFAADTVGVVGSNNVCGSDPLLGDPYDLLEPDFRPAAGSPAVNGSVPVAAPPAGNTFIVATDFVGALDYKGEDWTRQPWTTYGTSDWTEPTSTTTTVPPTTTTTPGSSCAAVEIYGEGSEEVAMLRAIRDRILSKSAEGQELIKMYYQLSPVIVQALKADPAFKTELKSFADEFLNTIN